MKFSKSLKSAFCGLVVATSTALPSQAIDIVWNYDYDTTGFFTEERKLVLEAVASEFNHLLIDAREFPAVFVGYWKWKFNHPSTGLSEISIDGEIGTPGRLTIYVGAYDLGGTVLGLGGPVGSEALTTQEWLETFNSFDTDDVFQPYAGSISITNSSDYTWYSGLSDDVPDDQIDLYSVVLHELGHVLGIGGSTAWFADLSNDGYFVGENVLALDANGIPVSFDGSHFEDGEWNGIPLIMNSTINAGQRYGWSALENAVLLDLGYVAIPEPGTVGFAIIGLGLLVTAHRRRRC